MIESPKNFIEQFQNFIEHIAGLMKTFLTKEVADNYYLGKTDKAVSAGTADTAGSATKATQDANGNVIPETYATKSELTSGLATKQPVGDYRTKSELDSIYLGINAKAKSAEIADVANAINGSAILGKVGITGNPFIEGSNNFDFTIESDCFADITFSYGDPSSIRFSIYINEELIHTEIPVKTFSYPIKQYLPAGTRIRFTANATTNGANMLRWARSSYTLYPISLYVISEEKSE